MEMRYERLSAPILNKNTIRRNAVTGQIGRLARHGILFVHSPAGYGKTTAVALWAQDKAAAWLSLDEYSSEPADIYKWLLFALSHKVSESFTDAPLEYTLNALQELQDWPEAVIIDDFHLCADLSFAGNLPLLRNRMPVHTAFIVISRKPPPAVLIEQTLKGRVNEISALQFSSDEITELFRKNGVSITQYEAESIRRSTDGWPAALAAILLSGGGVSPDLLSADTLHHYLRNHVAGCWDDYHILKKCSICDTLSQRLCAEITGQAGAWEAITKLADKTGLVIRLTQDTCRFHSLLKEFLESELARDESIDKPLLYKTAARYFRENGDIIRALEMASGSGDVGILEEYLRARYERYGQYGPDVAGYASAVGKYVSSKISPSDARQSLRFSLDCFFAAFYAGKLPEAFKWIDAAEKILWSRQHARADIISAALNIVVDPRGDVFDIPGYCRKVGPLLPAAQPGQMPFFTMTSNFPFVHKAQIDCSGISPRLETFLRQLKEYAEPVLGQALEPMVLLVEAGVRYERGELAQAEALAEEAVRAAPRFQPEIQFSSFVLYAEILRVQGKPFQTEGIGGMIAREKADYLRENFDAFMVNISLYDGSSSAAAHWLAKAEVENTLKLYKAYQYFTTARSLMVAGKIAGAEKLLERLAAFSESYRRPSDFIEALTLRSLCLWHMKRPADAVRLMTGAIVKAFELRLVMPIIKEGGDILPMLQKILDRLKYGYDADILDKSFVNELYYGARAIARHTGVMVTGGGNKPVKLSPRQSEVLRYLEQNLSHREIAAEIGVKTTTVDDHIGKLYEKLGVSNARDAILKAKEIS